MARPTKQGIDYFPLDVYLDDKFRFIEIKFGTKGFGVIIKLFQKIYANGFWYKWTGDEKLLFTGELFNVNINEVNDIINEAIERNIFDKEMYKKYEILTSKGIQRRYFEATKRRKEIEVIKEYVLIDNINGINANINFINVCNNQQSKVKESKVKESKVKESKVNNIPLEDVVTIIQQEINPNLNSFEIEMVQTWFSEWENKEIILEAVKETALNKATTLKYTDSILRNWKQLNIKSVEDIERIKQNYQKKKGNVKVESEPSWLEEHQEYRKKATSNQNNEEVDEEEVKKLLESFKEG